MTNRTTGTATPVQVYARIGGVLYLLIIVIGAFGQLAIRGALVVPGDAAATAENIMAAQALWRLGLAGDLMLHVFDLPLVLVLYVLLKPVNRNLVLLGVLFNLTQTAVLVANKSMLVVTLLALGHADYLQALGPSQLHALAYLFIRVHEYGFAIGLVFFGFACLVYGYLLFRSAYLPKLLGVLLALAGSSYLANSFTLLLAPAYAGRSVPVLGLALIGELSLALWLMAKGVDVPVWERRVLEAP